MINNRFNINHWIGIDVGGANVKIAHGSGVAASIRFEVWRDPRGLASALAEARKLVPHGDAVAATTTAELCDCFETKAEGVETVLSALEIAFGDLPISIWGIDEQFHNTATIRDRPALAAASNWLALAVYSSRLVNDSAILIDVGSTTTDLIPIDRTGARCRGKTDYERLQTGELVYAGVRRTPICAIASRVPWRGSTIGIAAEWFATTHDVYLTLKSIESDETDRGTADGRPATVEFARDRLARTLGADRETFSFEDARAFAATCDSILLERLVESARGACEKSIGAPRSAVVAGSGSFLARRLAERLIEPEGDAERSIVDLANHWDPDRSACACAFALTLLACERLQNLNNA